MMCTGFHLHKHERGILFLPDLQVSELRQRVLIDLHWVTLLWGGGVAGTPQGVPRARCASSLSGSLLMASLQHCHPGTGGGRPWSGVGLFDAT